MRGRAGVLAALAVAVMVAGAGALDVSLASVECAPGRAVCDFGASQQRAQFNATAAAAINLAGAASVRFVLQPPSGKRWKLEHGASAVLRVGGRLEGAACIASNETASLLPLSLVTLDASGGALSLSGTAVATLSHSDGVVLNGTAVVGGALAGAPRIENPAYVASVVLAGQTPQSLRSGTDCMATLSNLTATLTVAHANNSNGSLSEEAQPHWPACALHLCKNGGACSAVAPPESTRTLPVCTCDAGHDGLACSSATGGAPDTCEDGVKDGSETDVDCGGAGGCARCSAGLECVRREDCGPSADTYCATTHRCVSRQWASRHAGAPALFLPLWFESAVTGSAAVGAGRLLRALSRWPAAGDSSGVVALPQAIRNALLDTMAPHVAQNYTPAAAITRATAAAGDSRGVHVDVEVALESTAAATAALAALNTSIASGDLVAAILQAEPAAGVSQVGYAAGASPLVVLASGSPPPEVPPTPTDPDGLPPNVIAGVALLCIAIAAGILVLLYLECTGTKDAWGRGPIEVALAARFRFLDRSISRLNPGDNGRFTSGGAQPANLNPETTRPALPPRTVPARAKERATRQAEARARARSRSGSASGTRAPVAGASAPAAGDAAALDPRSVINPVADILQPSAHGVPGQGQRNPLAGMPAAGAARKR